MAIPFAIVLVLIVYGSLYPWKFTVPQRAFWHGVLRSWPSGWTQFGMEDALTNVMVYIPFGALAFFCWRPYCSARLAVATAILVGALLSLSMEVLQAFLPGRTSSLADFAWNGVGASIGALTALRFRKQARRPEWLGMPPILMLVAWAFYHEYPFFPSVLFSRMRFELNLWRHPASFSVIEIWSYAAEWIATATAVERLFGKRALRWLPVVLASHFVLRPFIPARPLVLEEVLGIILACLLWIVLPDQVRFSPLLLTSVILLRECAPTNWQGLPAFSWIPFWSFFSSGRSSAINFLVRAIFDYTAILWLWWNRGVSWRRVGFVLVSLLTMLLVAQDYLPGKALSMTDPVLALILALVCYSISAPVNVPLPPAQLDSVA